MALSGVTKIHRYGKSATFKVVRIWPQQSVEFIALKCFGRVPVQTHVIFQHTYSRKETRQSFFSAPSAFSVYMYWYAKNLVNISCFHPEPDFLVEVHVCLISENPNLLIAARPAFLADNGFKQCHVGATLTSK